jgi:hypothetical protein
VFTVIKSFWYRLLRKSADNFSARPASVRISSANNPFRHSLDFQSTAPRQVGGNAATKAQGAYGQDNEQDNQLANIHDVPL